MRWPPKYKRISVFGKKGRYLAYVPNRGWSFCLALGERTRSHEPMDRLDPHGLCDRTSKGTRLQNSVGLYTGTDWANFRPILKRLAEVIIEDETVMR